MTHYMDLPFGEGEVIKNYKEMCARLGEKERGGNSRVIQMERWENYFQWVKKGHKFIITDILSDSFPTDDNNHTKIGDRRNVSHYLERHIFDEDFAKLYELYFNSVKDIEFEEQNMRHNISYILSGCADIFTKERLTRTKNALLKLEELEKNELLLEALETIYWRQKKYTEVCHSSSTNWKLPVVSEFYVYRFLDSERKIIYVGKTTNIANRMAHHFGENSHLPDTLYEKTKRIQYLPFNTQVMMDMAELYFIAKFAPYYNTMKKHDSYERFSPFDKLHWLDLE